MLTDHWAIIHKHRNPVPAPWRMKSCDFTDITIFPLTLRTEVKLLPLFNNKQDVVCWVCDELDSLEQAEFQALIRVFNPSSRLRWACSH